MEEKTSFSVSMCVYHADNPEWFNTAVESILNQSAPPDEVVIVVDGPVGEKLNKVIEKYKKNEKIKVIRLCENMGHGKARRKGLENCSNELVALMDADDISLPDRFEKQLKVFEKKDISVIGGNIAEFIENPEKHVGYRTVSQKHEDIEKYLKKRCPFNQMTVMFKKSDVEKAGGYKDWFCNEDYYLWLRMYKCGMKFENIPDVLVNVRVGEEMYKRRGGKKYFKSEYGIQKYMLSEKIIGIPLFCVNVVKRFIVQVLLTEKMRSWVFKKFARKKRID